MSRASLTREAFSGCKKVSLLLVLFLVIVGVYLTDWHVTQYFVSQPAAQRLRVDEQHVIKLLVDDSDSSSTSSVAHHQTELNTGAVVNSSSSSKVTSSKVARVTVAVGLAITSVKVTQVNASNIAAKFQFFHTFLPTFCTTASGNVSYRFYLAYDFSDPVFSVRQLRESFQSTFNASMERLCRSGSRRIDVTLQALISCPHTGKPARAQNEAMLDAYLDNADYFYRINDDTRLLTAGWTEVFMSVLENYNPPRVGVTGPNHHGGNVAILTYDFVHRTHVDIFGFYYPRMFTEWFADDWMTRVYGKGRTTKVGHIVLQHTLALDWRYSVNRNVTALTTNGQIQLDSQIVNRYVNASKTTNNNNYSSTLQRDGRKVVAMSLFGSKPRYTWGTIRNAQLLPVYLPDWTLRVYIAADPAVSPQLAVPPRIVNKLRQLGAQIVSVEHTQGSVSARDWRLLVVKDKHVDYFLIRDADWRPTDREATAVGDWLSTAHKHGPDSAVVHCIRDHPQHVEYALVDGLWGGRPQALQRLMMKAVRDAAGKVGSELLSGSLTSSALWPTVAGVAVCHDSVSPCGRWGPVTSRRPFPSSRGQGRELFVGQKFNEHEETLSDLTSVNSFNDVNCSVVTGTGS